MLSRPLAALSRASRHLRPLTSSSSLSSRRSYITTTTLTASTPQALFEAFQALPAPSSPPSATFFALSLHSASASTLPAALFQRFPSASTIGCLSSPPASSPQQHSLSLAHFHDDAHHMHTVLRSAMRGRERAAVGRWRPLDEVPRSADEDSSVLDKAFADGDWSAVWGPEAAVLEGNTEQGGQGGSRSIEGLESVRSVEATTRALPSPAVVPALADNRLWAGMTKSIPSLSSRRRHRRPLFARSWLLWLLRPLWYIVGGCTHATRDLTSFFSGRSPCPANTLCHWSPIHALPRWSRVV